MEDYLIFNFIKYLSDNFHTPCDSLLYHKFIYFEKGKFRHKGDVSILKRHLKTPESDENADQLIKISEKEWCFPLKLVNKSTDYIHLFLNKSIVFKETFKEVQTKKEYYGFWKTNKKMFLQNDHVSNELNQLRVNLAMDLTERLVQKLGYELTTASDDDCLRYHFSNKSEVPTGFERIFVMGVEYEKKNCEFTAGEYSRLISSDVKSMSSRVDTPSLIDHLVDVCIKFNLFHASVASPSRLSTSGEPSHNTKDAIFVVYNYVRLKTILSAYQSKVSENIYPALPSIEETDFSLLIKDEEWGILLDHILRFPLLVAEFSTKLEKESKLHLHSFFIMLVVFSNQISRYYRRVRILTEAKPHLMETMFARLHLISACVVIYDVLFQCLGIVPPDTM